ncbi:hypothetical protein ALO94_200758 [Pseudomonas syringae pv. spinaceae]|uniref:Uncharacterized protein n=1 Tax=Pseudomonas syringae pv. spinaceae TaxID=264459 RepID=A0A0Q0G8Y2_PSESX|nr:hypothetical protein ALO94_200758 [Pseudomonas syringae pv. spinaceae]
MRADGDTVILTDAQANQAMRDFVGLGVKRRVAPRLVCKAHGNRIWRALHLRFKLAVQGLPLRVNHVGCIEALGQLPTLGLRQQRNVVHHRLAISDHATQYRLQITQIALDGAAVKQRGGVFHDAAEMFGAVADAQRQVELCESRLLIQRFQLQIAQLQVQALTAIPGQ